MFITILLLLFYKFNLLISYYYFNLLLSLLYYKSCYIYSDDV